MRSSSSTIINAASDGGVIVTSRQSALWVDRWLNVRTGSDREFRRRWIVLAVTRLEIHFSDHQSQPAAGSRSPSPTPHQLLQHPHRALPSSSSSINTNNTLLPSATSSPPLAVLPLSRVYLANATSRNCFNLVCDAKFFTFKCADAVEFEEVVAALTDLSIEVPQSIRNPSASLAPPPSSASAAGGDGGRSVSSRGGRRAGRNADGGAAAKSRSSPVMMFRGFSPQSAGASGACGGDAPGDLLIVDQRQRNPSPVAAAAALAEALRAREADADAAQQLLTERDAQILRLREAALAQNERIAGLESQLLRRGEDERDALAAARNVAAAERDAGLAALRHQLDAARCEAVDRLQREHDAAVSALRRSHRDELQRAASAHSASMQRLRAQLAAVSAAHCALLLQHPSSKRFVDAGVQCEILIAPVSSSSSSSSSSSIEFDNDNDDDGEAERKRKRRRGVESAQVAGLRDAMRRLRADIEGTPLFESPNILPSSGTVAPLPAAIAEDDFDTFNSPPRVVPSHLNDVPAAFTSARRTDARNTAAAASSRPRRTAAEENSARRNSNSNNSATKSAAAAAPDISAVLSKRNPYAAALAASSAAASKTANASGTTFGIDAARSSARRDSVLSAAGGGGGVSFNSSQSLPDSVLTGAGDQPHFGGANSLFSETASSAAMQQQRSADHGAIDQLLGAASRIYREYLSLRNKQHQQEAAAAQQAAAAGGQQTEQQQQQQQHDASSFCLLSSRPSTARPAGVLHMNSNMSSAALNVSAASLTASAATALSAELAALLCALLDMLKRRNREWLRHHLCAESIARFALALKRAGKILKSVKGAAGFAEDFAASWKITEHLIELPRLLIEEDQAFVLLHQLLSTAPSLPSGASSFLVAP